MEISRCIRLARRHAGLSQSQLAQRVGVHRSAVSHWEALGGKHPNISHLRTIATVTGVQFEWLTTGRGRMSPTLESMLDSVAAVAGMVIDDGHELRLIEAFRSAPVRARVAILELAETLAALRTGNRRSRDSGIHE